MERRLAELLADFGVPLRGFFYCPHHPEGIVARYAVNCSCRKPEPGMIRAAAREYGVSLTDSWLVGDILDDVEAGRRAGCRTVLLNNGHETIWRRSVLQAARLPGSRPRGSRAAHPLTKRCAEDVRFIASRSILVSSCLLLGVTNGA